MSVIPKTISDGVGGVKKIAGDILPEKICVGSFIYELVETSDGDFLTVGHDGEGGDFVEFRYRSHVDKLACGYFDLSDCHGNEKTSNAVWKAYDHMVSGIKEDYRNFLRRYSLHSEWLNEQGYTES